MDCHNANLRCKLSNGYIAMIERNNNPATGKPIASSLIQLKAIASAMGITVQELVSMTDGDTPVIISNQDEAETMSPERAALVALVESVPEDQIQLVYKVIQVFLENK